VNQEWGWGVGEVDEEERGASGAHCKKKTIGIAKISQGFPFLMVKISITSIG
jgi:hypothetical protein